MEDIKDILYDDVEQKFIELQDRKKKAKSAMAKGKALGYPHRIDRGYVLFCFGLLKSEIFEYFGEYILQ